MPLWRTGYLILQSLGVWVCYQGWKTLHWRESLRPRECFQTLQSVRRASVVCKKAKQFSWFLTHGDQPSCLGGSFLLLAQAGAGMSSVSAARSSLSSTSLPKEEGTFERLFLWVSGKQRVAGFCIRRSHSMEQSSGQTIECSENERTLSGRQLPVKGASVTFQICVCVPGPFGFRWKGSNENQKQFFKDTIGRAISDHVVSKTVSGQEKAEAPLCEYS